MKEILFPAILVDDNFSMLEYIKIPITKITSLSLKNENLIGIFIIDSAGNKFRVTAAEKISNVYPWWDFEFFNPMLNVRLSSQYDGICELSAIKEKTQKNINRDKEFWDADGELKTRIRSIKSSTTFRELIDALRDEE